MKKSLATDLEPILLSATIGAHAKNNAGEFRQKDVSFLVSLFINWNSLKDSYGKELEVQKVQISRYLDHLEKDGYVKKSKGKYPTYSLTSVGLIGSATAIASYCYHHDSTISFFSYYFLKSYSSEIIGLAKQNKRKHSPNTLKDIEELFNEQTYVKNRIEHLEREVQRVKLRLDLNKEAYKNISIKKSKGKSNEEIMEYITRDFPYELNNVKPIKDLLKDYSNELSLWEVTEGLNNRSKYIWEGQYQILRKELDIYKKFNE